MATQFLDHMTDVDHRRSRGLPQVTVEQMLHLSQFLNYSDRTLLQSIYERGISATALARAVGGSSKAIRRRVASLVKRMSAPAYRYVVRNRAEWSHERRAIADAVILRGNTHKAAAMSLSISLHRVRREVDRILALSEANSRN